MFHAVCAWRKFKKSKNKQGNLEFQFRNNLDNITSTEFSYDDDDDIVLIPKYIKI